MIAPVAPPERPPGLRTHLTRLLASVRLRAAAAAVVIVGTVLGLGGLGLVALLQRSLTESVTSTATAEALDIASFIQLRGHLPRRLPVSVEEMAAQVIGPGGAVLAASPNVAGQAVMVPLRPAPGQRLTATNVLLHLRRRRHPHLSLPSDSRFAVAAVGLRQSGAPRTVLVADSLGVSDHAVDTASLALAVLLPVVLLVVGGLVAVLAGWALRPVEAIRSEVEALVPTELHRRVPEPAGRDEIGRLAHTMNAMLGRLEAAAERQRQLVADVSHELRNPLASLRTQLEVAAAHPGPDTPALLGGAVAEIGRLTSLVADLLTLARFDEGLVPLHVDEVDVDEVVLAEADRLRRHGRVDVSVRGVGAGRVLGDGHQLSRLVANLADNAERHAARTVSFGVRHDGGTVVVEVADDGPGVPEPWRERIFERFVRLDAARPFGSAGAGLGLAIVREIARAHGGSVTVTDGDPGARFVVQLPVTRGDAAGDAGQPAVPSVPSVPSVPLPGVSGAPGGPEGLPESAPARSASRRSPSGPSAPWPDGT